jgi:hypothetical protein
VPAVHALQQQQQQQQQGLGRVGVHGSCWCWLQQGRWSYQMGNSAVPHQRWCISRLRAFQGVPGCLRVSQGASGCFQIIRSPLLPPLISQDPGGSLCLVRAATRVQPGCLPLPVL